MRCCIYISVCRLQWLIFIIPQTFQQSVTPTFTVTSAIYTDSSRETRATTAWSGDELFWNIAGPSEYDHKPEECIAYEGLIITPSVSNKTIINNGCTTDSSLVTDFEFVNGTGSEVSSTIYAFRFFHSPYVTFECKVQVCLSGEADCAIDCSGRRRRTTGKSLTYSQHYKKLRSRIKIETPRIRMFSSAVSASIESEVWWLLGLALVLNAV